MNLFHRFLITFIMTPRRFSKLLLTAEESSAYGEVAEKVYGINLGQFNLFTKLQMEKLLHLLKSDDVVLDVGCGNGKITGYIADNVGCRIKGIDFAEEAVYRANQKYKSDTVSFDVMNINKLNDITEKYSKIISIDSLYFFQDLKPVLRNMLDILVPGGSLVLFYSYNPNLHKNIDDDVIEGSLSGLNVKIDKTTLTEDEIEMWRRMSMELKANKSKFKKEGTMDFYRVRYSEARSFVKMGKAGRIRRFMYEVRKG